MSASEMSLRHFFEGMVRREEIASAYLATLLEYSPTFRERFLQLAFRNPDFVDAETWTTRVEAELVDVTVESSSTIVLIENKLGSGARMIGQLVRYYAAAVERTPQKRVVAVYLTPGGFGADEVEGVMTSPLRIGRTDDSLVIPWEEVARIVSALPAEEWFAHSGMAAIHESIENRRKEKFPPVGDRATLRRIVTEARNGLSARWPEARFALWVGQTSETVYSYGVPITVILNLHFAVEPEFPFMPTGTRTDHGIQVSVETQLGLAGKISRSSELGRAWTRDESAGGPAISQVGPFSRSGRWFVHDEPWEGPEDALVAHLVETGSRVLTAVRPYFSLSADVA